MFFQYNPATPPRSADVVWGHCSSPDLVNWDIHGIALACSNEHPGTEEFWSGNTIENEGILVAFYSAQRDDDRYQLPRMTMSGDGGRSFAGDWPTVPRPDDSEGLFVFRDPFVWRHDNAWRMLVGSGTLAGTALAFLYESRDLHSWARLGAFATREGWPGSDDLGSVWECPQYAWELGVLFIAAWRPETGPIAVHALKGTERDGKFVVQDVERADHGPDYYAPSVMRSIDGRYLLWGWIWEARDTKWRDEAGWAGMLSLPREVSLEDGRLAIRPARELEGLRDLTCCEQVGGPGELFLGQVPRAFELWLRLEGSPSTATLALELGDSEVLLVHIDGEEGRVVVDRDQASADARADRGPTRIEAGSRLLRDGTVELRWFVDHSVSELFLADGIVATTRFYPVSGSPWQLRVTAPDAARVEARVWGLRPGVRQAATVTDVAQ